MLYKTIDVAYPKMLITLSSTPIYMSHVIDEAFQLPNFLFSIIIFLGPSFKANFLYKKGLDECTCELYEVSYREFFETCSFCNCDKL